MDYFERTLQFFQSQYPETSRNLNFQDRQKFRERLSPNLFCANVLELPLSIKNEAEKIVSAFFALRQIPSRLQALAQLSPQIIDPGNTSALMCYDFHIDRAGHLRLIEINTNASLSLIADAQYALAGLKNGFCADFRAEIVQTFLKEYQASGVKGELKRIAIVDEKPKDQRLFAEFVLFCELFRKHGLDVEICDPSELTLAADKSLRLGDLKIDLVYNRSTDFYFESASSDVLRKAMLEKIACISPHPHEYRLLADKERLLELARADAIDAFDELTKEQKDALKRTLIPTKDVREFANADTLWADRKRWFFKPMRSFGGKATYRGASITRAAFAEVLERTAYLAQEFVPAPEIIFPTNSSSDTASRSASDVASSLKKFKYDLRFFAYRDRIQLGAARIYQGQLTNSQTPGGGIAALSFTQSPSH